MKRPTVDYDHLASSYNKRFEHDPSSGIVQALQQLVESAGAERILEVGCGTGQFLAQLSSRPMAAVGLDLSSGMLVQAKQRKSPLHLVQGRANQLPFPSNSFDLLYCVNAIHHFDQPPSFISAAFDQLRPAGCLAIIGNDPHAGDHHWYVYKYFEGVLETDLARFTPHPQIQRWMKDAGFQNLERREIQYIHDERRGRSVFDDPFLQKKATSQLALLSQEAYQMGMDRIRMDLDEAEASGREMVFRANLTVVLLLGHKAA